MNALRPIPPSKLMFLTCALFDMSEAQLVSGSRIPRFVAARTVFCGIAREVLVHSYPDIAEMLRGRRDCHTTVVTADQRWQRLEDTDEIAKGITKQAAREYVMRGLGIHAKGAV